MASQSLSPHPSGLTLDAYRLGLGRDRDRIDAHLQCCPVCSAVIDEMNADETAFLSEIYPDTVDGVTKRVLAESSEKNSSRHARYVPRVALGLAASVAIALASYVFFSHPSQSPSNAGEPYLGAKGDLGLEVFCRRAGRVFQVHEGDALFAGDMLRFVPHFEGHLRYVMVVAIDAAGTMSRYFPPGSDEAAAVDRPGEPLPGSIILDDATGPERILLLASPAPFDFAAVQTALKTEWRRAVRVDDIERIPLDVDQQSILFSKRP